MFKFIFVLFALLAFIGFALDNLLTAELLEAFGPLTNRNANYNTDL